MQVTSSGGSFSGYGKFKSGWLDLWRRLLMASRGKGTLTQSQRPERTFKQGSLSKCALNGFHSPLLQDSYCVLYCRLPKSLSWRLHWGGRIFFTFSGFLITALLIDEFARKRKRSTTWHSWNGAFTGCTTPLWSWSWCPLPLWVPGLLWLVLGTQIAAVFRFCDQFWNGSRWLVQ